MFGDVNLTQIKSSCLQKDVFLNVFTLRKRVHLFTFSHFTARYHSWTFLQFLKKAEKKSVQYSSLKRKTGGFKNEQLIFFSKHKHPVSVSHVKTVKANIAKSPYGRTPDIGHHFLNVFHTKALRAINAFSMIV